MTTAEHKWPIFVRDRRGREAYLTRERWDHALDHPGMSEVRLDHLLQTLRTGHRKQETLDPVKYKYRKAFDDLPEPYTQFVVVVKFGWDRHDPTKENNFVLTAYLT
ncbi:MAG: hypothetical protein ACE5HA_04945 [Anaerolineae bacterium]